jgi:hypothetical protein
MRGRHFIQSPDIDPGFRVCRGCDVRKCLDEFPSVVAASGKRYFTYVCRGCTNTKQLKVRRVKEARVVLDRLPAIKVVRGNSREHAPAIQRRPSPKVHQIQAQRPVSGFDLTLFDYLDVDAANAQANALAANRPFDPLLLLGRYRECSICGKFRKVRWFAPRPDLDRGYDAACVTCTNIPIREPKACEKCYVTKPFEAFHPRSNTVCRECLKAPQSEMRCGVCDEVKPALEFTKAKTRKHGRLDICRGCTKAAIKAASANPVGILACAICQIEKSVSEFNAVSYLKKSGSLTYKQPCRSCCGAAIAHARANPDGTKICRTCGDEKSVAKFDWVNVSKAGRVNYHPDCRPCVARKITPNKIVYVTPEFKKCKTCMAIKPADEFSVRRIRLDGERALSSECKVCANAVSARRDRAKRASQPRKTRTCGACNEAKPLKSFGVAATECWDCLRAAKIAAKVKERAEQVALRMASIRVCKACGIEKDIGEFAKHDNMHKWTCKQCLGPKTRKYGRDWTKNNKAGQRAKDHRRRALEMGAEGFHTGDDILRIHKAQRGRCCFPWCRKKLNGIWQLEHRVSLSKGGTNWPNNLQLSCDDGCNQSKGTLDEIAFIQAKGFLI